MQLEEVQEHSIRKGSNMPMSMSDGRQMDCVFRATEGPFTNESELEMGTMISTRLSEYLTKEGAKMFKK